MRLKHALYILILPGAIVLAPGINAQGATLEDGIKITEATNQAGIASQKKIDGLARETQDSLAKIQKLTNNTEYQQSYNAELQKLKTSQEKQLVLLQQQVSNNKQKRQRLVSLMNDMVTSLEKTISRDLPFHHEARLSALTTIKQQLTDENMPIAIPYRSLWEAYQSEIDYGNTLETYRETLHINSNEQQVGDLQVNILRVGHLALFYQTLNGKESGYWKANEKHWEKLPEKFNNNIKEGLLVANKQVAPQLINLPLTRSSLDE